METVQVTIGNAPYASALRELLASTGTRDVVSVETPEPATDGVIVVDSDALDRLPLPYIDPERIVLITKNDPDHLARAWNAGIRSVVFHEDPLSTAVLAIMAAELRVSKPELHGAAHPEVPSPTAPCGRASSASRSGAGALKAPETMMHWKSRERRG
jgi:hypothetical protein